MTYDVTQWLAEIKSLQKQLATIHQERDHALKSAANWRQLYETEAKQRRLETQLSQQAIAALQADLAQLQGSPAAGVGVALDPAAMAAIAQTWQTVSHEELCQQILQTQQECDRLRQSLRVEQAEHERTRQSLTSALSDAVDQLTHLRPRPTAS